MSSLQEIFARDPLELTRENIDQIVLAMREARSKYMTGLKAKAEPKAKREKSAGAPSLDDLGL